MLRTDSKISKGSWWLRNVGRTAMLTRNWQGILFSLVSVSATTAGLAAFNIAPYNVNMAFTLLTLVATVWFGLGSGVLTAVLSFLCFNYFFIPPYFTFFVDAEQGWVAVFLFFGTALFANQVAGRARLNSAQAEQRANEATALYELATAVLTKIDRREMLLAVLQKVNSGLKPASCALYLADEENDGQLVESARIETPALTLVTTTPRHPDINRAQAVFSQNAAAYFAGSKASGNLQQPAAYLPLAVGARVLGVMVVVGHVRDGEFKAEEKQLIEGFANHVALAVEHARLIQEAALVATLRDSDQLKSALLASVSHELRTPLTAIKTATANLQAQDIEWSKEETVEFLETIDNETNRLSRLVSNLLDLSRLEAHKLQPDFGWYYLPEIVEEVVERLKKNPAARSHPFTVNFMPDIPLNRMDYLQIDQVLTNLLENAVKYSPSKAPVRVQVEVRPAREVYPDYRQTATAEKLLVVKVLDEGRGIPASDLERIFDKFYRVRQSQDGMRDTPGSGIGLAIAKGIIEAHGGRIWAKNRSYGGSIFTFTLPVLPLDADFIEAQESNE